MSDPATAGARAGPAPRAESDQDRHLARVVDDLRRGEAVEIVDGDQRLVVLAAELATAPALAALEAEGPADLLLTAARAAVLNLGNQRDAAGASVVRIVRMPWLDLVASLAAADPQRDLDAPLRGPFPTAPLGPLARPAEAAIALAKRGGLLPALFATPGGAQAGRLSVAARAVLDWRRATRLAIVSRARLPLAGAEDARVVAFRAADGGPEHLAILIGTPGAEPLVRLHSACLTGDVLGSLKCDCGPQLRGAVARLALEGGILLYLQQEGRGIGLVNKLRAYALQDQGFDTVDANLRLGFEEDERDFDLGAAMLRQLGIGRIRLLSNNPLKAAALAAAGITVAAMVPHQLGDNPHNRAYLATKRDRQGHRLDP